MKYKIICREKANLLITVQRDDNGEFMAGYIRLIKDNVIKTIELIPDAVYVDMGSANNVCGIEIFDEDVWKKFQFDENLLPLKPDE